MLFFKKSTLVFFQKTLRMSRGRATKVFLSKKHFLAFLVRRKGQGRPRESEKPFKESNKKSTLAFFSSRKPYFSFQRKLGTTNNTFSSTTVFIQNLFFHFFYPKKHTFLYQQEQFFFSVAWFSYSPYLFVTMVQKTKKAYHLVRSVNESLTNNKTVCSNQSVLLTLSGGQDSICLLLIALQLKNQWDWKLSVLCCNHLWQKDSFFTTTHVFKVTFLLHIPLCFGAALQMVFSEQEARKWRSLTFQRAHSFYKHDVLFTGHSNSDRTETSLFNLFRGSGLQGVLPLYWNKLNSLKTFSRSQDSCFKGWSTEQTSSFYKNKSNNKQSLCSLTKSQTNSFPQKKETHVVWTIDQIQSQHFWMLRKELHSTKAIRLLRESLFWYDNQKTECHKWDFHNKINPDVNVLTIFSFLKTKKQVKETINSMSIPESTHLEFLKRNPKRLFVCNSLIGRELPSTSKGLFLFSTKNIVLCKNDLFWLIGRPLLCLNRFEITNLSHLWRLPLHPDQTNQNLQTSRNKMRKQILPLLRLFFNRQIENSLSQFSEIVFQEEQYLSFLTKRVSNKVLQFVCLNRKFRGRILVFNTSLFMGLPIIFKRRVVKLFLEKVTTQKVTFTQISKMIDIIEKHDL